ncbi:MAG: hypothetical protein QM516_06555 [Limnohabitans sp.]|nr:hypothetical protein [Limnohabitans sp.]
MHPNGREETRVRDAKSNDSKIDVKGMRHARVVVQPLQRARGETRAEFGTDARTASIFRKAVAHEMLLAREAARDRTFDPNDARWRVAEETQRAMQGAVLAFEDRRRILSLANKLGIRPFDANLIVALVQDRARRGESLANITPTLALLPEAHRPERNAQRTMSAADSDGNTLWPIAVAIAIVADAALFAWLMFG